MQLHTALADALVTEGTEVVFGLMGDANMHLVADLVQRCGVRFVAVRHEAAAVMAADGYSRATGRPGVATVTMGPGLAQTATALTIARHARSPVLLVAGDTPIRDRLHVQSFDQAAFAATTAGVSRRVRRADTLADDVAMAFRSTRSGCGPVVLDVDMDLQAEPRPAGWTYRPSSALLPSAQIRHPDPRRIEAVAALLGACERPVVLAGRGAVSAGARPALLALADHLGAPVATTLQAKDWFAGEPFDLGIAGGFSTGLARGVLGAADCVLAIGASLTQFTTDGGRLFGQARTVQVTVEPSDVGDPLAVDEVVLGDARLAAEALTATAVPAVWSWREAALSEHGPRRHPLDGVVFVDDADGLDPRAVVAACNRRLPAERSTVVGIGHFGGFVAPALDVADPRALFTPWEFGSIGVGVPFGLGVAAALPDRPTVVFEGDGSLMQCVGELDTIARTRLPVLVVVLDDRAYGAEIHKLVDAGLDPSICHFPPRDLAAVARGLGCRALTARTTDELESALTRLFPLEGPTVLHVPVSRQVRQHVF